MPRVALMLAMVSVGVAAAFAYFGREAEGGSVPQATGMAALMNPSISAGSVAAVRGFPVDLAPGDGRVRPLGYAHYAWTRGKSICHVDRSGAGGCFERWLSPVNAAIGDDDAIGSCVRASVRGLATDDVTTVTVVLKNGTRVRGAVVDNAFEIYLPETATPWDVRGEDLTLRDGNSVFVTETVRAPAIP